MIFSGKRVFVTGASRGIGYAISNAFKKSGAWVIGTTKSAKKELHAKNCNEWLTADFSVDNHVSNCRDFLLKNSIDILINNAGINIISPFLEINSDDYRLVQQVNAYAPLIFCQSVLPNMISNKWGRIVNVSSVWGKISTPYRASYSASKFAIDGMTIALAAEYSSQGILANCISPGFIGTDLTYANLNANEIKNIVNRVPIKRLGSVDEIAKFVLWLSGNDNTFITGQNIAIDGGFIRG